MSYNDELERTLDREHKEAVRDIVRAALVAVIWLAILMTLLFRNAGVSWSDFADATGEYSATN